MRIAIEVSHLNSEKLSGIGIYTVELIKGLRQIPNLQIVPVYRPSRFKYRHLFEKHVGKSYPWVLGGLGLKVDILHGPDFRVRSAWNAKRVATILDLAFLVDGMTSREFSQKKKRDLDRLLDGDTPHALIAISKATADDLIAYRPHLKNRVHTVLLGGDHFSISENVNSGRKHSKPYFLFVGNIEARKNILGIIHAFELLPESMKDMDLVLIGKPGFNSESIFNAIENSPRKDAIKVLGYCSAEDLQVYYQQALALVYPSWIEGFGIPVIEAMHLGCPVITSGTTSTAEIAGDCGWCVDPKNPREIAKAMISVAELSETQRKQQIAKASLQAQEFTWAKCAQETSKVYRDLLL